MKETPLKPLPNKIYLAYGSNSLCPLCLEDNSDEVTSTSVRVDGNIGFVDLKCQSCGSEWIEHWAVKKYFNLNSGSTSSELYEIMQKAKARRKREKIPLTFLAK